MQRLIKQFNYDREKLSEFMGKSKSHISNTLRLLALPDEVIKLVEEGLLTAGQVRPLVGRIKALEIAQLILKANLSSRAVENLVKKEEGKITSIKKIDANILYAEKQIEENLGLKTKIINKKNSSGKIVIEYDSLDQFKMLSKLLQAKK